jgi:hypothetical protein
VATAATADLVLALTGRVRTGVDAAAYDIDGFDTPASEVSALHARGRHVVCYIDFGTWEAWRPDARAFRRGVLGRGNGWPGERWLDIRRLSILEPIMHARVAMCARKRFDAIEPDNIDGFENRTGFAITARDQLKYDRWIARQVHQFGLAAFQKNDPEQARALEPAFDGALDEQCNEYHECGLFDIYLSGEARAQRGVRPIPLRRILRRRRARRHHGRPLQPRARRPLLPAVLDAIAHVGHERGAAHGDRLEREV